MKKIVSIIVWSLIAIYLIFMAIFVSNRNKKQFCIDVKVTVLDSISNRFVSAEEIKKAIILSYPKLYGSAINELDFEEMETVVEKHPAIESCQIYGNAKGIINIDVKQYKPLLRVFSGSASFYLDENGNKVPMSDRFNVRTVIVNGTIPIVTDDLLNIVKYIKNDPFWDAQVEQIYIRRDNEYVLVPRVGDHLILLGKPTEFEPKMRNLKAFYKQLDPKEWNEYRTINLKFKNQIVCSRNAL
jgi:cell division protein FtsQ